MNKIYVGLDELLDTRLGLISLKDNKKASEYLRPDNDIYFKRSTDKTIYQDLGISEETWKLNWSKRTKDLLKHATVTHIPKVINNIIIEYQRSTEKAIEDMVIGLDVNLYPYHLTDMEIKELGKIIEEIIPLTSDVNFIHLPLKELTPSLIKQKYKYLVLYDFNEWSVMHAEEIRKTLLATSHFFVPRLFNKQPNEEVINQDTYTRKLWDLDPFKVMESLLGPKMGITFIAASDFSSSLRPPIISKSTIPDLDSEIARSGTYTPHSSLYDPQYVIPREGQPLPE